MHSALGVLGGLKMETHALTKDEYNLLLEAIKDTVCSNDIKKRDYLLIKVLWKTAQRIGAVSQLQLQDIDFKEGRIIFTAEKSKTKAEHTVVIDDDLYNTLYHYLEENMMQIKQCNDYIFYNIKTKRHISWFCAWNRFQIYSNKAEIQSVRWITPKGRHMYRIHPHTTRGGVITHLLKQNVTIPKVQQLSGHKSVDCLMKHYCKLTKPEIQKELMGML